MSRKGRRQAPPSDENIARLLTMLSNKGTTPFKGSPHGGMSMPVVNEAVKLGLARAVTRPSWGRCAEITPAGVDWLAEHPVAETHTAFDDESILGWYHNGTWYAELYEITEELEPTDPATIEVRMIPRMARVGLELLQNVGPRDLGALTYMRNKGFVRRGELTLTPEGIALLAASPVVTPELVQALTGSEKPPRRAWKNRVGEVFTDFKAFVEGSLA